jgi:hypothetical protein
VNDAQVSIVAGVTGLAGVARGVVPLAPTVQRHLQDPGVAVFSDGTLVTYVSEVWLETDFIGLRATFFAWFGVVLLLLALWLAIESRYGGDPVAE